MKNKVLHTFVVLAYKESKDLEGCVKSVINQEYKSDVVIATSTPNNYIDKIAKKYNLKVIINSEKKGIAYDFNFAVNCVDSILVTIAHQDDIYEKNYSKEIVEAYKKNKNSSIIFSDYYELRGKNKIYTNPNLKIKRILLFPLKFKALGKFKFWRRFVLKYGNAISCPAVTFVKENIPNDVFICNLTCNVDWFTWEMLSKLNKSFVFVSKKLMGHRISESTTTSSIINSGVRTKEDLYMFNKFWPEFIAKFINKFYKKAEKSNNVKNKK